MNPARKIFFDVQADDRPWRCSDLAPSDLLLAPAEFDRPPAPPFPRIPAGMIETGIQPTCGSGKFLVEQAVMLAGKRLRSTIVGRQGTLRPLDEAIGQTLGDDRGVPSSLIDARLAKRGETLRLALDDSGQIEAECVIANVDKIVVRKRARRYDGRRRNGCSCRRGRAVHNRASAEQSSIYRQTNQTFEWRQDGNSQQRVLRGNTGRLLVARTLSVANGPIDSLGMALETLDTRRNGI